jgi:hypothetical protein
MRQLSKKQRHQEAETEETVTAINCIFKKLRHFSNETTKKLRHQETDAARKKK